MDGSRAKKLLENLIDVIAGETDLDVVQRLMELSGFERKEMAELGYGFED